MSLSPNQELFAHWLAAPKGLRQPKTQKELAAHLDVCPDTLSRWKKDAELQVQVYELAHGRLDDALPDILQVVIDNAMAGKFQFVKLILELTNKYTRKISVQEDPPQVGIEQYADLIRQIEIWDRERAGA